MLNLIMAAGDSNVSPAALWIALALVVVVTLAKLKGVARAVVIIVAAVVIYALKTNGLL